MTATQLPLGLTKPHRNQQLFSDYYLDHLLPARTEWADLIAEAAAVLPTLTALVQAFVPSDNEAQTEEGFIKPVLQALGHTFEVQAALRTPDGTKKPDYIFYTDTAARDANRGKTLDESLLAGRAVAVGDAKYWDRPLDQNLKRPGADPFTNKHPAFQIAFYIQHSGLDWGILTNGRRWRLYHTATAHKQDRFYEVDLPALIATNDPAAVVYFWAFFRRAAFTPQPMGLDAFLRASTDYARGVSDSLKAQVFDALRDVAQGMLDYPGNRLTPDTDTLRQLYDASLIVLYRLLFILYAEARELLPVRTSAAYRADYSLEAMTREIARRRDSGAPLLATTSRFWPRLVDLFHMIDVGNPPLQVATFNGGLFDPRRHPLLEQYQVGDARLMTALDRLARVDGQFVDYRDLAERHLGTIYEGLLEYHLDAIPLTNGYTVDLFNAQNERHRTGSYYTPDFVVQYMVQQTLAPILDAAVARATTDADRIAAVLNINCLDPAMGSGHFPVAAMEYIARYLVDLGVTAETGGEADLLYWKRRVAQSCIYGVDLNPLAVELAKLSLWLATAATGKPLSFLDHHLRSGNALIGMRMTDLDTPRPSRRKTAPAAPSGQLSMLDDPHVAASMRTAVGAMGQIERSAGATVADVKEQERRYAEVQDQFTRTYERLAHVATAARFGRALEPALWNGLRSYLTTGGFAIPQYEALLTEARRQAQEHHFFHWDMAFPEVFFTASGQPLDAQAGFDAVIGNPPYVRQEQFTALKPYLAQAYPETYHGAADLYVYFYQQGIRLLKEGGRLAYIVTNKWMRAGYGEALRQFFADTTQLAQIVDFGHAPIFADADVFPCIIVATRTTTPVPEAAVQVTQVPRAALPLVQVDSYIQQHQYPVPQARFRRQPWSLEGTEAEAVLEKLRRAGVPLAEYAGVKPYRGVLTGLNEAFRIDTPTKERMIRADPRSAELFKPYLRGQDIKRWAPDWDGLWMIVLKSSENAAWPWSQDASQAERLFAATFPAVYAHMKPYEAKLRARQDKGRYWWELRSCAYYAALDQPKILTQDLATYSWFCLDRDGRYPVNTCYLWPTTDPYLLAWLCSPTTWWLMHRTLQHAINDTLRMFREQVETLPIAPPNAAQREDAARHVTALIASTQADQQARRETLDWLRTEFGVEMAGQKLEQFATLTEDAFVEAVRVRRPKALGRLTPVALRELRAGYQAQAIPVQERRQVALAHEQHLAALVNAAYGLTPADVATLWRTAPPRMPLPAPVEESSLLGDQHPPSLD